MLDYYLAYEAKTYQQKEREPNWQKERQAALDTSGEKGTKHRNRRKENISSGSGREDETGAEGRKGDNPSGKRGAVIIRAEAMTRARAVTGKTTPLPEHEETAIYPT